MKEAHFIGVDHTDPEGFDRTSRALEMLRPDILAVEWAGPKHEKFKESEATRVLQEKINAIIKGIYQEFGFAPEIYDEVERISHQTNFGEVRAVREYAKRKGLKVIHTENSKSRIAQDLHYLTNPSVAGTFYRQYFEDGSTPTVQINFDEMGYTDFEAHLRGDLEASILQAILQDEITFNRERVRFQKRAVKGSMQRLPENGVFVHVGRFADLFDDGLNPPVNL